MKYPLLTLSSLMILSCASAVSAEEFGAVNLFQGPTPAQGQAFREAVWCNTHKFKACDDLFTSRFTAEEKRQIDDQIRKSKVWSNDLTNQQEAKPASKQKKQKQ